MKQYLLPKSGQFYKANLHCHTTMSDGHLTPDEVKKEYMEKGYSVVAFTDHEILFPHNDLTEEKFLALNGVEFSVDEKEDYRDRTGKKCHFCCIALDPGIDMTPCPDNTKNSRHPGNIVNYHLFKPQPGTENFPNEYSPEAINARMAEIKKYGFFLTYNHPDWSLEEQNIFCRYQEMDAMEIFNNSCVTALGFDDYNPKAYDALLRSDHRIFCVATDDNHNNPARNWDSFGGWTMIKAPQLQYNAVATALQQGHFYASQGPEIYNLYVEDGTVHITCSPAAKIVFTTGQRHRQILFASESGHLTEGAFVLDPNDLYFRVTVTDIDGKPANTNAYFLDTLNL